MTDKTGLEKMVEHLKATGAVCNDSKWFMDTLLYAETLLAAERSKPSDTVTIPKEEYDKMVLSALSRPAERERRDGQGGQMKCEDKFEKWLEGMIISRHDVSTQQEMRYVLQQYRAHKAENTELDGLVEEISKWRKDHEQKGSWSLCNWGKFDEILSRQAAPVKEDERECCDIKCVNELINILMCIERVYVPKDPKTEGLCLAIRGLRGLIQRHTAQDKEGK